MPRTVEQNNKIKLERSNDILAASLKLFSVVGYDGVSVDLITSTVNCSHGLFYHYYTSVEDVFNKVIKSADKFDFDAISLNEVFEAEGIEGLKTIAEYFGSEKVLNDAFLCYAKIFLGEIATKPMVSFFKKKWKVNNAKEFLSKLVERGQAAGKVIAGDPLEIAECIRGFLLSYVSTLVNLKKKDRKPISANTLLAFVSKK